MTLKVKKFLIVFTILNLILYAVGLNKALNIILPITILTSSFFNPLLSISIWASSFSYNLILNSIIVHVNGLALIFGLIISIIRSNKQLVYMKSMFFYIVVNISVIFSFMLSNGYNANILVLFIISISMFTILIISFINEQKTLEHILIGFCFSGINMIGLLIIMYFNDPSSLIKFGRLNLLGSIRQVANAMALPIYFLSIQIIDKKNYFFSSRKKTILLLIILSLTLILTASRGVIIAVVLPLLMYMVFTVKNIRGISVAIMVTAIIFIIGSFENSNLLRLERILNFDFGMNLRGEFWIFLLNKMSSDGLSKILFGYGFGGVNLINVGSIYSEFYAHSVFVDYLINFGIIGFSLLSILIITLLFKSIFKKKYNSFYFIILTMLMFLSHGDSQHILFWVYLSIANMMVIDKNEYNDNTSKKDEIYLDDNVECFEIKKILI